MSEVRSAEKASARRGGPGLRIIALLAGALAIGVAIAFLTAPKDYDRRVVDIPMRDGVRLHTIILTPKGAHDAPILLNRTPFGAERRLKLGEHHLASAVPMIYRGPAAAGYILAFQDVRGKFGSGGDYVVQRPLVGPLNHTGVDHSTDAWDTIDWLVRHVPGSDGRVGMVGTSYDGFLVLMAEIHPHPALRAAVAINPLVNGWMGDDWFHSGAFRQVMMPFLFLDNGASDGTRSPSPGPDDYATMLAAGSAGAYGAAAGLGRVAFWNTLKSHPAYDALWQDQALEKRLAAEPHRVPTLYVASLWDQEDGYGAIHAYAATRSRDPADRSLLVLGPWFHGQANGDGSRTGPLRWASDTSAQFRTEMLQPFLDSQLKTGAPRTTLAPVMAFETGTGLWRRYAAWPLSCAAGCAATSRPLYLLPDHRLGFSPPSAGGEPWDAYVSDPSNPVPYSPRPDKVVTEIGPGWSTWLLEDQRRVSARPDVLTYVSDPLTSPLQISGEPELNLFASTSGTDSDWVVKLIDVYPEGLASSPALRGYELAVGMEIFRGRYRRDPAHPEAITPDKVELYRFALPTANHVFQPGHRIMVQVQSSWFPLYDRNPQSFVGNIFEARASDYRVATQRVFHTNGETSFIELPVVPRRGA